MAKRYWEVWVAYPGSQGISRPLGSFRSKMGAGLFALTRRVVLSLFDQEYKNSNASIIVVHDTFMRGAPEEWYKLLTEGLENV